MATNHTLVPQYSFFHVTVSDLLSSVKAHRDNENVNTRDFREFRLSTDKPLPDRVKCSEQMHATHAFTSDARLVRHAFTHKTHYTPQPHVAYQFTSDRRMDPDPHGAVLVQHAMLPTHSRRTHSLPRGRHSLNGRHRQRKDKMSVAPSIEPPSPQSVKNKECFSVAMISGTSSECCAGIIPRRNASSNQKLLRILTRPSHINFRHKN